MDHLPEPKPSQELPSCSFPIVGIGASAGGLEAFKELLSYVEDATGMAYVFVQHLAPTHESLFGVPGDRIVRTLVTQFPYLPPQGGHSRG